MKKFHLAPYCLGLSIANCILPTFLGKVAASMRFVYNHRLEAGTPLPLLTELSLELPLWFYVFTIFSFLAVAALFIRKVPVLLMVHGLLIVCILEGCALFSFALSLCLPFFTLTDAIGK